MTANCWKPNYSETRSLDAPGKQEPAEIRMYVYMYMLQSLTQQTFKWMGTWYSHLSPFLPHISLCRFHSLALAVSDSDGLSCRFCLALSHPSVVPRSAGTCMPKARQWPFRQVAGPPWSGAGVGVSMLRGAGDSRTWKWTWTIILMFFVFRLFSHCHFYFHVCYCACFRVNGHVHLSLQFVVFPFYFRSILSNMLVHKVSNNVKKFRRPYLQK